MLRYLVSRPIAIIMLFLALIISGLISVNKIPVSLLPDIDVPRIVIHVNYPNASAESLDHNVIRTIREAMGNLDGLVDIQSVVSNHAGVIYLSYQYGLKMDLAYIDVNEKIDELLGFFPRDMERPKVVRVNTSDIPVIRVQVLARDDSYNIAEISELAEKVLRKRLEQVPGVSLVDMNGLQEQVINVTPDVQALNALGLNEASIVETIRGANEDPGILSVRDGSYRYFIRLKNAIQTSTEIAQLPVRLRSGNSVVQLQEVAKIEAGTLKPNGYHQYNDRTGLVITIQKQAKSRMNELMPRINAIIAQFRSDYPALEFYTTQDQSFLLDAGISNLYQDLIIGGILTIALLFLFLGNWEAPTLMCINIPVSLIITLVFFYVLDVSFNIISLSGLALGIGMLIDNSIVVIDSISRKHRAGLIAKDASIEGVKDVAVPVVSQVLTTIAVYAPLILLNGMASSLIEDQSIALTISLLVSLLVAFILTPVLYWLFIKGDIRKRKENTIIYNWISRNYHKMIARILRHKLFYFSLTLCIMFLGIFLFQFIPVSALPQIEKRESLLHIDWNASVDAQENLSRVKKAIEAIKGSTIHTEADVGLSQFILQEEDNDIQRAAIYYSCRDEQQKEITDNRIMSFISKNYPEASLELMDAPNAFTKLFVNNDPFMEARFRSSDSRREEEEKLNNILSDVKVPYKKGLSFAEQRSIDIVIDHEKLAIYQVPYYNIENALKERFGNYTISELKRFGEVRQVKFHFPDELNENNSGSVQSLNGTGYPLNYFITTSISRQPKYITSDRGGRYYSLHIDTSFKSVEKFTAQMISSARKNDYTVSFSGRYFDDARLVKSLTAIFFIVLALIYVILAVQYEDLILPFLVMLTIPIGVSGGLFLLWLAGGTIDVMACIGFIVVLGLIVDDPTLKIEVLQRLNKEYISSGLKRDDAFLEKMIHEAGEICLKPLLMVSLTTSFAMLPVLFMGGIGNDLQRPLALVIIGGLTVGTFFTTWFIPLAYWYVIKWRR